MKNLFSNLLLSILAISFCFFISELYFRYFYAESNGLGVTLAHKKWGDLYWKPINSLGLRDKEWKESDLKGKKIVAVIGDSFPAGHGIKDVRDRFSNVLASKLGEEYAVLNIALPGWGTETELLAFKYFVSGRHFKFDTVIWSYFPNDIFDAAEHFGKKPPDKIPIPEGITGRLISSSYFLNYVYWNIFKIKSLKNNYFEVLKDLFNDPQIWALHKKEIEQICSDVKSSKARLIVITFPLLTHKINSTILLRRIKEIFNKKNVPVFDVSEVISNLKENEIVVSKNDAHPSVKLHKLVADKLYEMITN